MLFENPTENTGFCPERWLRSGDALSFQKRQVGIFSKLGNSELHIFNLFREIHVQQYCYHLDILRDDDKNGAAKMAKV